MKSLKEHVKDAAAVMLEIREEGYNMTETQEAAVLISATIAAHTEALIAFAKAVDGMKITIIDGEAD